MRRRAVEAGLIGATVSPIVSFGQQAQPVRVGALFGVGKDATTESNLAVFRDALAKIGWVDGRDLRIEDRWADGALERVRTLAAEWSSLKPAVIFTSGIRALNEQRRQDRTFRSSSSPRPIRWARGSPGASPGPAGRRPASSFLNFRS